MHDPTPQRVDGVAESEHFERVTLLTTLTTGNVMNLTAVVKKAQGRRRVMHVSEVSKKVLQSSQTRQRPARANTSTNIIFRGNPTKGIKCSLPAEFKAFLRSISVKEGKSSAQAKDPAACGEGSADKSWSQDAVKRVYS